MLTVGLNPSLHEFPKQEPFRRFPLLERGRDRQPSRYLDAMSRYFRTDPYRTELRDALREAYDGCGERAPTYSGGRAAPGSTVVRAAHVAELRAAVTRLEAAGC